MSTPTEPPKALVSIVINFDSETSKSLLSMYQWWRWRWVVRLNKLRRVSAKAWWYFCEGGVFFARSIVNAIKITFFAAIILGIVTLFLVLIK